MDRHVLSTTVLLLGLIAITSAEIKLIRSTATTLEWNIAKSLQPGKKHTVEVLLNDGGNQVRVIDEPLAPKAKTYKAFNLKSNKLYQLKIKVVGGRGGPNLVELSRPSYTNLRCYSCEGAFSVDTCTDLKECSPNERQCYTRLRYGSITGRMYLFKGCKVTTDVCTPNKERMNLTRVANKKIGDLSNAQVLATMPGLRFFGDVQKLLARSPSILKQVKKKFGENRKKELEETLREKCSSREDPDDFCRCCCSAERCNHALLDCGVTPPPDEREDEPLPPDIATTKPEVTFPTVAPKKVAPVCQRFNGGCDHTCIPLNKTTVRCECFKDYKLQADGKTCKTHLKRAIADAGPDIEVTLPQDSVTLSANNTLGSVKRYRWWDPIASGDGAGLTVSDSRESDILVTNLKPGKYKFILMVTGMDGRRTSDMMILTVNPNPASINATAEAAKKKFKPRRPRVRAFGQSRFRSTRHRKQWKKYVEVHGVNFTTTTPEPRLRFTTTKSSFNVIKRTGGLKPRKPKPTTPAPTTKSEQPEPRKPVKQGPKKPGKQGIKRPGTGTKRPGTGTKRPGTGKKGPGTSLKRPLTKGKGTRKPVTGGKKPTKRLPQKGKTGARVARPRSAGKQPPARLRMAPPKPQRSLAPEKRTPATRSAVPKNPLMPKKPLKTKTQAKPKVQGKPKAPVGSKAPVKSQPKPKAPAKSNVQTKPEAPVKSQPKPKASANSNVQTKTKAPVKSQPKPKAPAKSDAPTKPKKPVKSKAAVKPKVPIKSKTAAKPKRPMRRVPVRRPGMANSKPGAPKLGNRVGPKRPLSGPKRPLTGPKRPLSSRKPSTKPIVTTTSTTTTPTTTTTTTTTITTTTTTTEEPKLECPALDSLERRRVLSNCSVDGLKCDFTCEDGMKLRGGSKSVICDTFGEKPSWMNGASPAVLPCCELPCPANAHADIVFLIHSVSKTGKPDWIKLLNFVSSMVSKYTIGKENVCIGAVRYNSRIDTRSEIPLDCSITKANFKKALLKMPFVGVGANTGAALNYLRTKAFKSPHARPHAPNVAVLVSDSRSVDDVIKPAKALKATGTKIEVIGVKTRGGSPNTPQLKSIASNPAKIVNLPRIPIKPPPLLEKQMNFLVCSRGCQRYGREQAEPAASLKSSGLSRGPG